MSENTEYLFNVRPTEPDERDYPLKLSADTIRESVDLREYDSPIEDQGILGSCVSHATTSAYEILIQCRENLMRKMELWAEEDIARHGVFEKMKQNMIEFEEVSQCYNEDK
jgi:hypothetical protein